MPIQNSRNADKHIVSHVRVAEGVTDFQFVRDNHVFKNAWGDLAGARETGGNRAGDVTVTRLAHATQRQARLTAVGHDAQWYSFKWEGRYVEYLRYDDTIIDGDYKYTVEQWFNRL